MNQAKRKLTMEQVINDKEQLEILLNSLKQTLQAQALVETVLPASTSAYEAALAAVKPTYHNLSDRLANAFGVKNGQPITSESHLWMADEKEQEAVYNYYHAEMARKGWACETPDTCALLQAERRLSDAEQQLISNCEPLTSVAPSRVTIKVRKPYLDRLKAMLKHLAEVTGFDLGCAKEGAAA